MSRACRRGRDEHYFDDSGQAHGLYSGYHYGFAGFNADKAVSPINSTRFLTYSHDSNLIMLRGRADVAVVTRSYLHAYQQHYPEQKAARC